MWPQDPGSLTRIIAAMVAPRNTSSETIRGGRGEPATAAAPGAVAGKPAAIVSVVAMEKPPLAGSVQESVKRGNPRGMGGSEGACGESRLNAKTRPGERPGRALRLREETLRGPGTGCALFARAASADGPGNSDEFLVVRHVVRAAEYRSHKAGALRNPPRPAHPRMPA